MHKNRFRKFALLSMKIAPKKRSKFQNFYTKKVRTGARKKNTPKTRHDGDYGPCSNQPVCPFIPRRI